EVVGFFKTQGKGWQTKINDVLQDYVNSHHAA
nr:BrnA antitoxin family protein [Desulfobacterales bacterium]